MASPFTHVLPGNDTEGTVGTTNKIQVRWQPTAIGRIASAAADLNIDAATFKKISEHFAYLSALRLGKDSVKIVAGPHAETTDSATKKTVPDAVHITIDMSGQLKPNPSTLSDTGGPLKCHVYLSGLDGVPPINIQNIRASSETVLKKGHKGTVQRLDLSYGSQGFPGATQPAGSSNTAAPRPSAGAANPGTGPAKPPTTGPAKPATAGPAKPTTTGPAKPATAGPAKPATTAPKPPTTGPTKPSSSVPGTGQAGPWMVDPKSKKQYRKNPNVQGGIEWKK
ncbi:hypothetical protein HJFPF1_06071 [Paramyrothecium foliicola]|nr:hypothetical protein HJFPF1_06071 [Paramyrothecium foliicola]